VSTPERRAGSTRAAGFSQAPFIVFEGVEGCGKSTQIDRLAARLEAAGRPFLVTREPGGTPLGDALRDILLHFGASGIDGLTELYLLEAARRAHVCEVIRPALGKGILVICDRFADSSVAYQGGGRELGIELVEEMNRRATGNLTADLTILLDLPAEEGLARIGRRGRPEDRLEREELAFHTRVRDAYLRLAERRGDAYRVVDALLPPERVSAIVSDHLTPFLKMS
jgi:dTMP kinase